MPSLLLHTLALNPVAYLINVGFTLCKNSTYSSIRVLHKIYALTLKCTYTIESGLHLHICGVSGDIIALIKVQNSQGTEGENRLPCKVYFTIGTFKGPMECAPRERQPWVLTFHLTLRTQPHHCLSSLVPSHNGFHIASTLPFAPPSVSCKVGFHVASTFLSSRLLSILRMALPFFCLQPGWVSCNLTLAAPSVFSQGWVSYGLTLAFCLTFRTHPGWRCI